MTEYCTAADVEARLTTTGYLNVADRDADGTVSADELNANISMGIQYAGGVIDSYIQSRVNLQSARNAGNAWLRDRAIDIAVYRVVCNGGRDLVQAFQEDYRQALVWLERVRRQGDGIPGLSIESSDWIDGARFVFQEISEYLP